MAQYTSTNGSNENSARIELAAAFRLAHHYGFSEIIWNHISLRLPDAEDRFLINPLARRYDEMRASDLILVDVNGNAIGGGVPPIAGFVIHSAIHCARSDVKCVMHCHNEAGLVVSTLEEGLIPLVSESLYLYDDVGYHDFEGVSTDLGERSRLAENLGSKHALILRNHGLLTVGGSVVEAFMRMFWLDIACRVQVKAMSTGGTVRRIPDEVCRHVKRQMEQFSADFGLGVQEWPALLRLADKLDPGFRH